MDPYKNEPLLNPGPKPLSESYPQCLDAEAEKSARNSEGKQVVNIYLGIHSGEFSIYYSKCDEESLSTREETILFNLRKNHCTACRFRETG